MSEKETHDLKEFRLRAKLPQYFRYAAVLIIAATILVVVVGFYRERSKTGFRLKSEHTQLSSDVVASVNGYERLESDGDLPKYYIKADYAKTFADNHQELQNVYLEIYDETGTRADTMTAEQVLYVPASNKDFTAYMKGSVTIESRDRLKIMTPNIVYTKSNETAEADELVEFERDNVRGKSFGASVRMGEKRVDLLRDVDIETFETAELASSGVRYSNIKAGSASFDQISNKIDFNGGVAITIDSKSGSTGNAVKTDVNADRAVAYFANDASKPGMSATQSAQLKKFELFDNVKILSVEGGSPPTNIEAGYALYDKSADRYELKNGTHIVTTANDESTDIRAREAIYEPSALKITLDGSAEITQATDYMKGDAITADLYPDRQIRYAVIRGSAVVRQSTASRTMTVSAPELNATFGENRQLAAANAIGRSTAELVPAGESDYTLVTMTAPRAIRIVFKGDGLLSQMQTDGRTTIQLNAVGGTDNAANKRVTADTVKTVFADNGKDIRTAEAVGNAELYIEPLRAAAQNYRTTINAPRFDCEFYAGNNARSCVGGKKAKAVRVPTVAKEGRGTQTVTADQLNAVFSEQTKDVERLDAAGNAKFTELDRSAIASQMSFTQNDETVRLRGGEPTAWDSRSRAKAREFDWDTANQRSYLRGSVSTTYYTRKTMGDSLPFASADKPVFLTADVAEFDHVGETATYSGNARGWQDDNYVRGDRFFIKQPEGKFQAEGSVQSAVYNVKQKLKGRESSVPVFASAAKMTYDRSTRVIEYRENVDIRQGSDRLTSASADVYLNERNELSKTVAENSVVITQPGRRATGNWVQYSASDEIAIVRGTPATINDSTNGSTQSSELTFYMRENRVISEGKTKPNGAGRIRSVYNVKPNQ